MTKKEQQRKRLLDVQLEIDNAEQRHVEVEPHDQQHQINCLLGIVQDLKYFCETLIEENPQLLKNEDSP